MMKTTRRATLSALLTGTALALSAASMASAQDDLLKLTIALGVDDTAFNVTTSSVFQLAGEWGFYAKYGLEVTFVALDGTPQAVAALQSGDVDAADISLDAAIRLTATGDMPLRGIVAVGTGSPFLIAARTDITTVADLVGRSYAIADNGSLDHSLTQAVLRGLGVDPAGPAYVAIGAPAVRVQALAAGQIDATTVSFGTYGSIEGTEGIHILVPSEEFSTFVPAVSKFIAVTPETATAKEEELQRFTLALIDAARELEANPARWVEAAAAARSDLKRETIERTSGFIANRWCINGCLDPAEIDASVAFVYANPDFAEVPVISAADVIDLRFTTRALATLGTAQGTGLDSRP